MRGWRTFVAIGDSFTEGVGDAGPDGRCRGWADRVAEVLAEGTPGFRYANLAIRRRLLANIVTEQVPIAESYRPDLITFCAGGNDVLQPRCDVGALGELYRTAIERLVATGADVVVFTGFEPVGLPMPWRLRRLITGVNELMRDIANVHGCRIVDLWSMASVLHDRRAFTADRLHLSPAGHRRVALHTLETLRIPTGEDWRAPWPPAPRWSWREERRADARWVYDHLRPFVTDIVRRRDRGAVCVAKRPALSPFPTSAAQVSALDT